MALETDIDVNLVVDKGEDYAFQIFWTDQYDQPLEITHPLKMTVSYNTPHTYISTSETPGANQYAYLSYSATSGLIQLSLPDSYTNTLTAGVYRYDLWAHVSDPDDVVNLTKRVRIFGGSFTVRSAVTTF